MRARGLAAALALLLAEGCLPDFGIFTVVDGVDAGADAGASDAGGVDAGASDAGGVDAGGVDAGAVDAGRTDAGARDAAVVDGGAAACPERPLPCLDPTRADVTEIPSEAGAEAFDTATPGQIIQVRARTLTGLAWIPTGVTLRGCEGARIAGSVAFSGGVGFVEGFEVTGQVVANRAGTFTIRDNHFSGGPSGSEAAVEARSIDALVSAHVRVVVERNRFESMPAGVAARTRYDTMVHAVTIEVRNSVFEGVDAPILLDEAGLVGAIDATLRHDTFVGFATALRVRDVAGGSVRVDANLFARGDVAVSSDSAWDGASNMTWTVTRPHDLLPPLGGTFTEIADPFVDVDASMLDLAPGSAAIDAVAPDATLADDQRGCPRPVGPRSDVGALEAR